MPPRRVYESSDSSPSQHSSSLSYIHSTVGHITSMFAATSTTSCTPGGDCCTDCSSKNPRKFPDSVKQQCWKNAETVKGRDPDRWRQDDLGNPMFRKYAGSPKCYGYEHDHTVPYSKGGKSTAGNCSLMPQSVNRYKSDRTDLSKNDLKGKSPHCPASKRDLDRVEYSGYGNVRRCNNSGCKTVTPNMRRGNDSGCKTVTPNVRRGNNSGKGKR